MTHFKNPFKSGNSRYDEDAARDLLRGNLLLEGIVRCEHFRRGRRIHDQLGRNIIPTEGLDQILDVVFGAVSKDATIYCGIFKGNVSPAAGNTASSALGAAGTYTEAQDADYDVPATNRPVWTDAPSSAGSITNSAAKASFTIDASITIYGAFLVSSQAKTATTGVLYAAKRFDSSRAVVDADVLQVTYTLTLSSS